MTKALSPRPVAIANGYLPITPMRIVMTAATSAVTAATCSMPRTCPSASGDGADDERVEHDDVGHREEGRGAAAHLLAHGRAALADVEVPVEAAAAAGRPPCVLVVPLRRHGRQAARAVLPPGHDVAVGAGVAVPRSVLGMPRRVRRPDPPPLETNDAAVVLVGTSLWAGALLVLAVLELGDLARVRGWWIGMCAYGVAWACSGSGTSGAARPRSTATPPAGCPPVVSEGTEAQEPAQGRPWRGQSPQERREARRRRLLDAALELFGTTGYAATSLTALCAQAGVSPRHFYELYAGREPLMADLYDEIVLETARLVDEAYAAAPLTADGPHPRRAGRRRSPTRPTTPAGPGSCTSRRSA